MASLWVDLAYFIGFAVSMTMAVQTPIPLDEGAPQAGRAGGRTPF
jgi:hypothetical protein